MSIIRVNPDSVRQYGSFAQERFQGMRGELEALVRDVVAVRYFGPNAAQFKTRTGELAAQFATTLSSDLDRIAQAVSAATRAIAQALGGTGVELSVETASVAVPAVDPGDGTVDIDTSALEGLKPVVAVRFGALEEGLASHLARLQATDWEGTAKQRAVGEVTTFTRTAQGRIGEARSSIDGAIDAQVASVLAADR